MPYLTHDEYKQLGFEGLTDVEFNKLLPKASAVLDNVTNNAFHKVPMLLVNSWIVERFKLALCSQIAYFNELGSSTFEGINNSPQSFSAGRTAVSNASRFNPSGENESKSLIAEEVLMFLEGTGLLYAGVSIW